MLLSSPIWVKFIAQGDPRMSKFIDAAHWLDHQHKNRQTFKNFDRKFGLETYEDAYCVQNALRNIWSYKGELSGYKLALTSKPIQEMFGVDTPIKGNIFAETILHGDRTVFLSDYVNLGIEFELCVEIGEDFGKETNGLTIKDCYRKIAAIYPSFELIDDRNANYDTVNLISATADNAWNANSILGSRETNFQNLDFCQNPVTKIINGEVDYSQTGAALANPFNSVLWIANYLSEHEEELLAGQLIMTGSTFATYFPQRGDEITYNVQDIGEVKIEIV